MASPNQSVFPLSRLRLLLPGLVLIAFTLLYCVYWFVMAGRLETQLGVWVENQRQRGYEITYAQVDVRGFPFRFEYHFDGFSAEAPGHPNQWQWQSEKLLVMMQAYRLSHGIAEATGLQKFSYQEDLRQEARAPDRFLVEGNADVMRASLVFEERKLSRVAVDIQNYKGQRQGRFLSGPQPIALERGQLHMRPGEDKEGTTGTDVFIKADGLSLPPRGTLDVWREPVALSQVKFHLAGYGPQQMRAGTALAEWAEGGGKIIISDLAFNWGELRLDGTGDVRLDGTARPEGEVRLKIAGHGQLIDMLTDVGTIDRKSGQTANTALTLLAMAGGDPEGRVVTPFKMKEGSLFLGPIKLGRLEPIDF